MSDLPMAQKGHPSYSIPDATQAFSGETLKDRIDYDMQSTNTPYDPDVGGKLIDEGTFKRHQGAFPPKVGDQ